MPLRNTITLNTSCSPTLILAHYEQVDFPSLFQAVGKHSQAEAGQIHISEGTHGVRIIIFNILI